MEKSAQNNQRLMSSRHRIFFVVFLLLAAGYFLLATKAQAQTFSLSPSSATKPVGEEFTVDINIDTAGKAVAGADVKITFDPEILEIDQAKITEGSFFSDSASNVNAQTGTLYVAGYFREQFETKTGTGKVATVTLKGKKAGSSALAFVCTAQTNDSNILDASANDIINCSGISNGNYTIGGSSSGPTSTPASTGTATATPTPPVSGVGAPTIFALGAGALLTFIGLAFIF